MTKVYISRVTPLPVEYTWTQNDATLPSQLCQRKLLSVPVFTILTERPVLAIIMINKVPSGKTPMRDEPLWTCGSFYLPLPPLSPSSTDEYDLASSVVGSLALPAVAPIMRESVYDQLASPVAAVGMGNICSCLRVPGAFVHLEKRQSPWAVTQRRPRFSSASHNLEPSLLQGSVCLNCKANTDEPNMDSL